MITHYIRVISHTTVTHLLHTIYTTATYPPTSIDSWESPHDALTQIWQTYGRCFSCTVSRCLFRSFSVENLICHLQFGSKPHSRCLLCVLRCFWRSRGRSNSLWPQLSCSCVPVRRGSSCGGGVADTGLHNYRPHPQLRYGILLAGREAPLLQILYNLSCASNTTGACPCHLQRNSAVPSQLFRPRVSP